MKEEERRCKKEKGCLETNIVWVIRDKSSSICHNNNVTGMCTNYGVLSQEFTHELKTNNTRMVWNSVHRNVLYKILDSYRLFQVSRYWR